MQRKIVLDDQENFSHQFGEHTHTPSSKASSVLKLRFKMKRDARDTDNTTNNTITTNTAGIILVTTHWYNPTRFYKIRQLTNLTLKFQKALYSRCLIHTMSAAWVRIFSIMATDEIIRQWFFARKKVYSFLKIMKIALWMVQLYMGQ